MDGFRQDLLVKLQPIIKNTVLNTLISLSHIQLFVRDILQNIPNQKSNDEALARLIQFLLIFT